MRNIQRAVLQQCDSRCRAYLLFMNDNEDQVDKKIAVFQDFLHIFLCTASYKADLWPFFTGRHISMLIFPLNLGLFALLRESPFGTERRLFLLF